MRFSLMKIACYAILLTFCMLAISCAIGSESEKKSKLNYLSGEHYQSTLNVSNLPIIVKRKKVNTTIEGTILLTEYNPLKFTKILLQRDNKTILETTTDNKGFFKFTGYLTNGEYTIKVDSKKMNFEEKTNIEKYEIKDLLYIVNETK